MGKAFIRPTFRGWAVGLLFFFCFTATAAELATETDVSTDSSRRSFLIGHNATQTTYVLKRGDWTIGNFGLAYGVTDSLLVATSPWIHFDYNTINLNVKWVRPAGDGFRWGVMATYFESYSDGDLFEPSKHFRESQTGTGESSDPESALRRDDQNRSLQTAWTRDLRRYQWKSATSQLLMSLEFMRRTTVHTALAYSYFWNDDFAYSLRMDPGDDSIRGQVNLTTLTEVDLDKGFRFLFEIGSIGLNYRLPFLHTGSSFAWLGKQFLLQLGASYTAKFADLGTTRGGQIGMGDDRYHRAGDGRTYSTRYYQASAHPEIQLQWFF